jgi:hypothetical protein
LAILSFWASYIYWLLLRLQTCPLEGCCIQMRPLCMYKAESNWPGRNFTNHFFCQIDSE